MVEIYRARARRQYALLFPNAIEIGLPWEGRIPYEWLRLLYGVLEEGMRILCVKQGSIMLVNSEDVELNIVVARGLSAEWQARCRLRRGEGMAGWVWVERQYLLARAILDGQVEVSRSELELEPSISYPIFAQDEVVGVINLGHGARSPFIGRRALELIGVVAGKASLILENCRLYQEKVGENEIWLHSLVRAMGACDSYTRQHCLRVTHLALQVGQEMELPAKVLAQLRQAGLLHDIGKIGIRGDILRKEGRLTGDELRIIQQHPAIGAAILGSMSPLAEISQLVLHHHERYDGSGYPHHLKGEDIPLLARIIAAADAFEAITADRPYRQARDPYLAGRELQRCAGAQFDPQVVRVLLALVANHPQKMLAVPVL